MCFRLLKEDKVIISILWKNRERGRMTFWNALQIISVSNQRFSAGSSPFFHLLLIHSLPFVGFYKCHEFISFPVKPSKSQRMAAGITVEPFLLSFPVIFAFSLISLNFLLLPNAFAVTHPSVVTLMTVLWECWAALSLTQPAGRQGIFWRLPALKAQPVHWGWNQAWVSRSLWM